MTTNQSVGGQKSKTEIIAFSSGKGGTGKTLFATCLSYALTKIGLKVLVVDSDTATDGISLYLLGPFGIDQVDNIPPDSTLNGILHESIERGEFHFKPWEIHRSAKEDHGIDYQAIISGKQLYGDLSDGNSHTSVQLDKASYRKVMQKLFDTLREQGYFDYVIVDTRGGFSNESTDVSALADSYIVVTEADVTSFYQNRNLIRYIDQAASELDKKAVLRAIIVNKSPQFASAKEVDLDNIESSFRLQLEREFPISYKATYPFPLSIEALTIQKSQQIPIRYALDSDFSYAFFVAFQKILSVVTQPWTKEQVAEWNYLVESVNLAIQKRNNEIQQAEVAEQLQHQELEKLRKENAESEAKVKALNRELDEVHDRYKRELERTDVLAAKISGDKVPVSNNVVTTIGKPRRYLATGLIGILMIGLLMAAWFYRSSFAASPVATASPVPTVTAVEPTATPIASATAPATVQGVQITETPLPTETVAPTDPQNPSTLITGTPTPVCPSFSGKATFPNNAHFVGDLTIPDGTVLSPGQAFVKKWYIQNIGSATWTSDYLVAFGDGTNMDGLVPLHFTGGDVSPGQCVEVSINMVAPTAPGSYIGYWILQANANKGSRFGFDEQNAGNISVNIVVMPPPTATPTTP